MNDNFLPIIRVMGLHSIAYCERLFYLEEVEKILLADERIFEGRRIHEEIKIDNNDIHRIETFEYTSEILSLTGKVDRLQKRDGEWIPYEYKKGRSKTTGKNFEAWEPDIFQIIGYSLLIEESTGRKISEGRIKYLKNNVLVKIQITDELKEKTHEYILKAKSLFSQKKRPPVSLNQNLCIRCSLAPVCLPEENRVLNDENYEPIRLFPPGREQQTIHITGYKTSIHKSGETITIEMYDPEPKTEKIPTNEMDSLIIHGNVQISSQLISFLAYNNIPIHWFSGGGNYIGSINSNSKNIQRKLRQYESLSDEKIKFYLAKKLILSKCESQF